MMTFEKKYCADKILRKNQYKKSKCENCSRTGRIFKKRKSNKIKVLRGKR